MAKTPKNKSAKEVSDTFHSIMGASVKGKAKTQGIEVQENYRLPFDSEFDWRVTLFQSLKDLYIQAILEETQDYSEESYDFEWKDAETILNQSLLDKLPQKIHERVLNKIQDFTAGL